MVTNLRYDTFRDIMEATSPCQVARRTFVSQADYPIFPKPVRGRVWWLSRRGGIEVMTEGEEIMLPMTDSTRLGSADLIGFVMESYGKLLKAIREADVLVELVVVVIEDSFGMAMIQRVRGY